MPPISSPVLKEKSRLRADGYAVIKNLVTPEVAAELCNHIGQLEKNGAIAPDTIVAESFYVYRDPLFESVLEQLLPKIEEACGCRLYKTYSYARQYKMNSILPAHRDREACEFTVSLTLGYEGKPWPIWVKDRNGHSVSFSLEAGDALIFQGIDLDHWRELNTYGNCSQLFLHYVDQQGPYAQYRNDQQEDNR